MGEEIRRIILEAIPDAEVFVHDPDGEHFQAFVISPSFAGMPLIKQHKMVMTPLKEAFATKVHALGLKTFTPEKWLAAKDNYTN